MFLESFHHFFDEFILKKINFKFFYYTFASLKHKNYRLWFIGQIISLLGSWIQVTAQGYLVYQLTSSAAYLGYVTFVAGIPVWIFMLYGGVIADRVSKKLLLFITQSTMMLCAFVLAFLIYYNYIQAWHILITAFIVGLANAFDAPARQAFVVELIEKTDLTNAIALNSLMFNLGVFIGPALGGFLYAYKGAYICFLINGLSFVAILIAITLIQPKCNISKNKTYGYSMNHDLIEGIKYVVDHPAIKFLIANIFIICVFGLSIHTIIPAWAVRVLKGDSVTTGLLYSIRGLGAIVGSLIIAGFARYNVTKNLFFIGLILFPLILLLFVFQHTLFLSLSAILLIGISSMLILNNANALIQMLVKDEMRGRVMSIYAFMFFGASPLGGLLIGFLSEHLSERYAILIVSLILIVTTSIMFNVLQKRLKSCLIK